MLTKSKEKKIPIFKSIDRARDLAMSWPEDRDSCPIAILRLPKRERASFYLNNVADLQDISTWNNGIDLQAFLDQFPLLYELYGSLFGQSPTMASAIEYEAAIGPHIDRFARVPQLHLNLCRSGPRDVRAARVEQGVSKIPEGRGESFGKVHLELGLSSDIYYGQISYKDITIMDSSLHEYGPPKGSGFAGIEAVRLAQCVNPLQNNIQR